MMAENNPVLSAPLVAVAGQVSERYVVTLIMHKGYDRPPAGAGHTCDWAVRFGEGVHVYPFGSWPVYAVVRKNSPVPEH